MQTESLERLIAAHEFFAGCPADHIAVVNGCASNLRFAAGELLCREGDEANDFYIIREGHCAVETHTPGHGRLTMQTVGAGDVVGWSWLVPPFRYVFDVRAVEPVRAIRFDAKCLRGKCDADPALGYDLLQRVTHQLLLRLQSSRAQLLDMYRHPGEAE